jgi:hypothetical protein
LSSAQKETISNRPRYSNAHHEPYGNNGAGAILGLQLAVNYVRVRAARVTIGNIALPDGHAGEPDRHDQPADPGIAALDCPASDAGDELAVARWAPAAC